MFQSPHLRWSRVHLGNSPWTILSTVNNTNCYKMFQGQGAWVSAASTCNKPRVQACLMWPFIYERCQHTKPETSRHRHFSRWAYHQSAHSHHHHLWLAPAWVITWPHYTLWSEELKDTISESYTLKLNIAWQRLFLLSWDQIGAATFRTNIRL